MRPRFDASTTLILVQSNRLNTRLLFNESLGEFEWIFGAPLGACIDPFDFRGEAIQTVFSWKVLGSLWTGSWCY